MKQIFKLGGCAVRAAALVARRPVLHTALGLFGLLGLGALSGCANTAPAGPKLKLADYQHIALVQHHVPGPLLLEYRSPNHHLRGNEPGFYYTAPPGTSAGTAFAAGLAGGLIIGVIEQVQQERWLAQRQEFNQLALSVQPGLSARLHDTLGQQLAQGLRQRLPAIPVLALTLDLGDQAKETREQRYVRLMAQVRQHCARCDLVVMVDPAIGYLRHLSSGYRAHGEVELSVHRIDAAADKPARFERVKVTELADRSYQYGYFMELRDDVTMATTRLPAVGTALADAAVSQLLAD